MLSCGQGTDLAPTALREAGIQDALASIGWDWEDYGDIDFKAHFASLSGDSQGQHSQHHHSVQVIGVVPAIGTASLFALAAAQHF